MQRRDGEDIYISYYTLRDQVKKHAVYKDIVNMSYHPNLKKNLTDLIAWIPSIPNIDLDIFPTIQTLRLYQDQILLLAKQGCSPLVVIYKQLFEYLWTEDNIKKIREATKLALNQGKILIATHFEFDEFFNILESRRKTFHSMLSTLSMEKKELPSSDLINKTIEDNLEMSELKKILISEIDSVFATELPGWEKYQEARRHLSAEKTPLLAFVSPYSSTTQKSNLVRIQKWKKILDNEKEHALYPVAIQFENVNKDLKSLIEFINENIDYFPTSFKKNVNEKNIIANINEYYTPALLKERVAITFIPPKNNLQLRRNYRQVVADLKNINYPKDYVYSLGQFFQNNLYRLAIVHHLTKMRKIDKEDFFSIWAKMLDDLLISKHLSPAGELAVIQASIKCLKNMKSPNPEFRKYLLECPEEKHVAPDAIREKWCNDLIKKEPKYYPDGSLTDVQESKTLFLRLIAVYYIKNALCTGLELNSKKLSEELVSLFGEEVIASRGFLKSHISSVLHELDIPAVNMNKMDNEEKVKLSKLKFH